MTTEIKGVYKEQIQELQKQMKDIEEKNEQCEIIKTDVIKELEKEYNFKSFKDFKKEFGIFLNLLDEYFRTGSEESKQSVIDKIPVLRDLNKW